MASFENSTSCSSSSITHFLDESPTVIHAVAAPMPGTSKGRDDLSIIEAVEADLKSENTEGASETYYSAGIYSPSLAQDDYFSAELSVNLVRYDAGRVSVENIVHEKRLAEALKIDSTVTFIDLGSGYESDPQHVTLPAMEIISTKYRVSPLFLDGGPVPHLGGIGYGVRSNIVFSETTPNVVCGYHVWYSLPLRTSLRSAASSPESTADDTPTVNGHPGYTTIPLNMRLYTTYNHTKRNSVTILYSPHGTDCIATLRKFIRHSTPLDVEVDPFAVHLLYLTRAVIDWRKVLQDITNELTHYEREIMTITEPSGLKITRQLHSLAIVMARIGSEMRITIDILNGLQRAHDEFYNMVLKASDRYSRPPIYHRLQSDFLNLAETFNSRLIEVVELQSRVRNCSNLIFHMLYLQHLSYGPARVAAI